MMNKNKSNHILNRLKIVPVFILLLIAVSAFTNPESTVIPTVYESANFQMLIDEEKKDSTEVTKTITVDVEVDDDGAETKEEKVITVMGFSAEDSVVVKKNGGLELHGEPHIKVVKKYGDPMVVIDGEESSVEVLNKLDAKHVKTVFVIKDEEAVKLYGDKGEHDVIVVTSKDGKKEEITVVVNDADSVKSQAHEVFKVKVKGNSINDKMKPLVIINGKECSMDEMNKIDPEKIISIDVNKSEEAVAEFGEKAKNGVIKVFVSDADVHKKTLIKYDNHEYDRRVVKGHAIGKKHKFKLDIGEHAPIFYVDGVETSKKDFEKINPAEIESISVLKDASAVKKYGSKAENGVIEIILKK